MKIIIIIIKLLFLRARYCLPEMTNYELLINEMKIHLNQHIFRPVSFKFSKMEINNLFIMI